ncbi:MAG TPA: SRPBCC family protein [Nitrospiria bacterium]|nr:SRPBCC family protein [Nitrospiria bacterium]
MRALFRLIVWLAGLALVVLIASKVLLEPTYVVSTQVVIHVAPGKVWEKVGALDAWPAWVDGLQRLSVVKGGGREVGSLADVHVYNGFQGWDMTIQIVETVPDHRLRYQVLGGPQNGVQSTIELTPSQDARSTTVSWNESDTPGGLWGNLLAVGMKLIVETQHDASLNQLKFALERA